jgi:acylphosphatase
MMRLSWPVVKGSPAVGYNGRMRVARKFLVSGHVQGVGFRYFAQDAARCEGLSGHVTNLPDGTVEAVAEGEVEALDRFEQALRRGPSRSRIERVVVDGVEPTGLHTGFDIR